MRTQGQAMRQMSVDDLTEKIRVVQYETQINDRGDIVKTAESVRCKVWAKVLPLSGRINDTTPERINTVTYRITIRYRKDITPEDEIVYRERRLKIKTVPIDLEERHVWLQFDCEEVVADGTSST